MDNDLMARRLRPPSEPAPAPQPQAQPVTQVDSAPLEQEQFPWETVDGTDPLAGAEAVWTPAVAPVAASASVGPTAPLGLTAPVGPPQPMAPHAPVASPAPVAAPQQMEPHAPVAPPQPMGVGPMSAMTAPFVPQSTPAPFAQQPTPGPFPPQPQTVQTQAAEPITWPTTREEAPWDRPNEYPQASDLVDPDEPAWDRPSPTDWIDPEQIDDRTPDMFETYPSRQMATVAAAAAPVAWPPVIAAPEQQPQQLEQPQPVVSTPADPYDAYAPVLGDVAIPAARHWPETNGHDHARNAPTVSAIATPAAAPVDLSVDFDAHAPAQAHDVGPAVGSTFTLTEPTDGPPAWATHDPVVNVRVPVPPSGMGEGGRGPTPPAELFENATVVEARLVVPEPQAVVPPANSPMEHGADDTSPKPAASLYSTAPPTPLVVRIELAFVDGSRQIVDAAENARWVGPMEQGDNQVVDDAESETEKFMPRHPAFEPRGPRAQEIYDMPAPAASPYEAPTARPSPVISSEHAQFAAHAPAEPFVWPPLPIPSVAPVASFPTSSPELDAATDWIEPTAHVQPIIGTYDAHAAWPNEPVVDNDPSALPPPWIRSTEDPAPQPAPWAAQPAPWAAQDRLAPEDEIPPLAPRSRPIAPASVADAAPAWPEQTYGADPLSQLPAAPAPTPSAWPQPFQQSAPTPSASAPWAAASSAAATPSATPFSAPSRPPHSYEPPAPIATTPIAATNIAAAPIAATPAAPSLLASDKSDLWFLSTEPDTATVDGAAVLGETIKEPSPVLTATLTIVMAVFVIVLVFVFIWLMTSLLG